MHAYEIAAGSSTLDGLRRCERPDPVPLSDGAGEIVAVGAAVTRFRVGQHKVVIRF